MDASPQDTHYNSQGLLASTFELQRTVPIDSLKLTVEEYRHPKTGAVHLHLASDSPENVFMVALRTVPKDSTGVAHILEHTVLCGSEKYPVRDPFFMMLRRSLNTFMNAFTSSDWTAYPFATQNKKDFDNLLSVYLDAVFFSRLDPLDFAQEGHRVEFERPGDQDSDLVYKGVVFNEMKGAMSSTSSVLWDRLSYELFPSNTYHFNSGGDPEVIPSLTYQDLRDFYASHYHPSNAIFLTFGDLPAQSHQEKFESWVLQRFEPLSEKIAVDLEQPFDEPRAAHHHYAVESSDETSRKTHLVLGWKLGESADLTAMLEAQLISAVLMENSASPLMHYLETTPLGNAPSSLCGVEESMREMVFCCGIEGSEAEHAEQFEQDVLRIIEECASTGVSEDRLEAILHQIELHQREISGDGMPYGLSLMLRALSAATHYGDAVAALDLDPVLADIRQKIQNTDYIPSLLRQLLLDNPHRVQLTVSPSPVLSAERVAREKSALANLKASLSENDKHTILDLAEKLKARQAQVDDPEALPKVTLEDIPADIKEPSFTLKPQSSVRSYRYPTGTNGLVYQQIAARMPASAEAQGLEFSMMMNLLNEVGLGSENYLTVQDRHSATVGSLAAGVLTRSHYDNEQACEGFVMLSSKALANRADAQIELMRDTLNIARFDEHTRIREIISQIRSRRDQSVTGSGHVLAMHAATSRMSPLAKRTHELGGLVGIQQLRDLDKRLQGETELAEFASQLDALYGEFLSGGDVHVATIAEPDTVDTLAERAVEAFSSLPLPQTKATWQTTPLRENVKELWLTNTQVNFCAKAFPTVPAGHKDAPHLTVLAAVLRNGFLHRAIREQGGAYGGGASQDGNIGAFRFFSYRDPRLLDTLADFDRSIDWIVNNPPDAQVLEEAILSVMSSMDKPGSPAGEAKKHFHEQLFGRTGDQLRAFRRGIIETTAEDLVRVASTYLHEKAGSIAVITQPKEYETNTDLKAMGFNVQELM
jgi:hypothetical protein